ncbi:MAG: hypothetical protein IJE46_00190 [Clostridia bacterium]|nr:hypothetical protein [Clostridia bacterium]
MKEALKYIILIIGSFFSFIAALLAISFPYDKDFQQMPLLLILPELALILFITTSILCIVWSFKFANNQPHKKIFLKAIFSLIATIIAFNLSLTFNPLIISMYTNVNSNTISDTPTPEKVASDNISDSDTFERRITSALINDGFDFNWEDWTITSNDTTSTSNLSLNKNNHYYYICIEKDKTSKNTVHVTLSADKSEDLTNFEKLAVHIALSIDAKLDIDNFTKDVLKNKSTSKSFDKFSVSYSNTSNLNMIFTFKK